MKKVAQQSKQKKKLSTLAEFAQALKQNQNTVRGWVRRADWKWNRKAPWLFAIVPDVLRWAADELERGRPSEEKSTSASEIKDLRKQKLRQEVRKLRANADQAETALAKERGSLHDADACEEEAVHRASLYRTAVQNLPSQVVSLALSNGLPHAAAPVIQKQIEELVNGCLRYTAASADARSATSNDAGDASIAAA